MTETVRPETGRKAAHAAVALRENEPFEGVFLLKGINELRAKNGKPYLAMTLATCDVEVEGRMWDADLSQAPDLAAGDPVRVRGTAERYQDRLQVKVDALRREDATVDPRLLYPASRIPEAELRDRFGTAARSLRVPELRSLFAQVNKDEVFLDAFFLSPAAVTMHHARIGGLAEHSLGALGIARAVADLHPWLDGDVVAAGCLLHDAGKVREYAIGHAFEVTLEGRLVGHVAAGVSMVEAWASRVPGFPDRLLKQLIHIVISHHGQLEHGSPKAPATPEALVVHFADDLDAKLDMLLTAGSAAGGEEGREAFVRGLRRSFLFFHSLETDAPAAEIPARRPSRGRVQKASPPDDDQGRLF